jgi:sporulation protein YlmC with PRC-barrel domain
MLRSLEDLKQYGIHATDGDVGHVKDFYFDDVGWVIRYLVVDTSAWLPGRKVLISPFSVGKPNWGDKTLPVQITQEQVRKSPNIDMDKPVSRQHEDEFLGYYGYPYYWGGAGLWGAGMYPGEILATPTSPDTPAFENSDPVTRNDTRSKAEQHHDKGDSHLRGSTEVIGYHIMASDGEIGHVSEMLVDEKTWAIRYLIVDTSNWWMGHKVLIAPLWIDQVLWPDQRVTVNLTRKQIQDATPYDASVKFDREQESAIYQHYGRTGYWENEHSNPAYEAYD